MRQTLANDPKTCRDCHWERHVSNFATNEGSPPLHGDKVYWWCTAVTIELRLNRGDTLGWLAPNEYPAPKEWCVRKRENDAARRLAG